MGRWFVARIGVAALVVSSACGRVDFDRSQPDAQKRDATQLRRDCEGHEDALLCDGFEDPALAKWNVFGQTASMQLVQPMPPHGDRLLQADTTGTMQTSDVFTSFTPVASGMLYLRGWFYVPTVSVSHFELFSVYSLSAGGLSVLGYFDKLALYQSTSGSGSKQVLALPLERWMCLELAIEVANPGNMTLTLDGGPAASFTNIDLAPAGGFEQIAVGIPWTTDGQTAARVYADEFIVDTKPIGCD